MRNKNDLTQATSASASSRSLRLSESQLNVSCSCLFNGVIVVLPICIDDLRSEIMKELFKIQV